MLFFIIWFIAFLVLIKYLIKNINKSESGYSLVGNNIEYLIPTETKNKIKQVFFISPYCPPCNMVMEQLVNDDNFENALVFVLVKNNDEYKKFINKYNNLKGIYPTSIKLIKEIKIEILPTILSVNDRGKIVKVKHGY